MVNILISGTAGLTIGVIISIIIHRSILRPIVYEYNELVDRVVKLEEFISEMQIRAADSYKKITEVDKRGSFSSDDEVGFVFSLLKSVILDTYTFLTQGVEKEE